MTVPRIMIIYLASPSQYHHPHKYNIKCPSCLTGRPRSFRVIALVFITRAIIALRYYWLYPLLYPFR